MRKEWLTMAGRYPLMIGTYRRESVKKIRIIPVIALMMLNTKNDVILQYEVFCKEIKPRSPVQSYKEYSLKIFYEGSV